jgi:hypothetical protein
LSKYKNGGKMTKLRIIKVYKKNYEKKVEKIIQVPKGIDEIRFSTEKFKKI